MTPMDLGVSPAVEDKPISGVRLGVTYPEITAVQVQSIIEAACCCKARDKGPSGNHPLVGTKAESEDQTKAAVETAEKVMQKAGVRVKYMVGTMNDRNPKSRAYGGPDS
jgi:hypothetical protein